MILELYTKNFSLTEELSIETSIVPRVGETITLQQDAGYLQGETDLIVYEVTHALKDNRLTPIVRCCARSGAEHRRDLLTEQGWL